MKTKTIIQNALIGIGMLMTPTAANAQEVKQVQTNKPAIVQKQETVEDKVNAEVRSQYFNKYRLRGVTLFDNPVLQTTSSFSYKKMSGNIFVNYDIPTGTVNEVDGTVGYNMPAGKDFTVSAGYTKYTFPNSSVPSSDEIYLGVQYSGPIRIGVTSFADVGTIKGTYTALNLAKDFKVGKSTVTFTAELGHNANWLRSGNSLSHLELRAEGFIPLGTDTDLILQASRFKGFAEGFKDETQYGVGLRTRF